MKKLTILFSALSVVGCGTTNNPPPMNVLTTYGNGASILVGNDNTVVNGCSKKDFEEIAYKIASLSNATSIDKQNAINAVVAICSNDIVVSFEVRNEALTDLKNGKFDKILAIFKNEEKGIHDKNLPDTKIKDYIQSLSSLNEAVNNPIIKQTPPESKSPFSILDTTPPKNSPPNPNPTVANPSIPPIISIRSSVNDNKQEAAIQREIGRKLANVDIVKAIEAYRRATQLDPDNADGWNGLVILLLNNKPDTIKLNEIIIASQNILRLAQENKDQKKIMIAYSNLGEWYRLRRDWDKAIEYYSKALQINERLEFKEGMKSNYTNLGKIYEIRRDWDKAIKYYSKALQINESLGLNEPMANDYIRLGNIYIILDNGDKADEYYSKALEINEILKNKKGIALSYACLGTVYLWRSNLDKAENYYNKAFQINQSIGHKEGMAHNYGQLGVVYQKSSNLDKAEKYYNKALQINQSIGHKEGMAIDYNRLASLYATKKNYNQARTYWEKSLALYKTIGIEYEVKKVQVWLDGLPR